MTSRMGSLDSTMRVTLGSQVGMVIAVASRSGQSTRHDDKSLVVKHSFRCLLIKMCRWDRKVQDFAEET